MQGLRYWSWVGAILTLTLVETSFVSAQKTRPISRFAGNPRRTPVVGLVQRVKDSVVNIHSERLVQNSISTDLFSLAPSRNRINGMGTAIVIDPRGYLITNQHVIENVSLIRARLADGTTTQARVVASDEVNDLALLKIDVKKPLPVMPLGTAKDLMLGETMVAIGNAYGYDHTVSVGVVSALDRDVKLNQKISYEDLIQTDAAINPGNSGGPLMNIRGELVGVNVAIRAGAQGIGFAIPVDTVMKVAADLLAKKRESRFGLGMECRDVAIPHQDKALERYLIVEKVTPGGVAAEAGLKRGDVLRQAGKENLSCRLDLERVLMTANQGETLTFRIRRGEKAQLARLKLGTSEATIADAGTLIWKRFGMRLIRVKGDTVETADSKVRGGLFVLSVSENSPATQAGIRQGDVLIGLHEWEMTQLDNVTYVLKRADLDELLPLQFYVIRDRQVHRGWIRPRE